MTYIIYCDESADRGPQYADFFGGCLVDSRDVYEITAALERKKSELHLNGEIKWTKVTDQYLDKYKQIMDMFFSFVREGKVKVRIMFRDVNDVPSDPHLRKVNEKYFKLYYQFIKYAFGLKDIPDECLPAKLIINLDVLPDKHGQKREFKEYLCKLPNTLHMQQLEISENDIAEVDSHKHVLLQCTDIIMGAMYFRLNELHLVVPEGQKRRGKKTIAKEKLYKHIYSNICTIHPYFNIGLSTGFRGMDNPHWQSPYEHWKFKPN